MSGRHYSYKETLGFLDSGLGLLRQAKELFMRAIPAQVEPCFPPECPRCEEGLLPALDGEDDPETVTYCPHCGQALDWECFEKDKALELASLKKRIDGGPMGEKLGKDLKPCPHCGGRAVLACPANDYDIQEDIWRVSCLRCLKTVSARHAEGAAGAWNGDRNE